MNTLHRGNKITKQLLAIIMLLLLFFSLTYFSACTDDWGIELLNGYELWKINSQDIALVLCTDENQSNCVIDRYITEFCYGSIYIGIKRLPVDPNIPYHDVVIEEIDPATTEYYLINSIDNTIFGPFTSEEYEQQVSSLGITDLCDWIKTVPKPDGAKY